MARVARVGGALRVLPIVSILVLASLPLPDASRSSSAASTLIESAATDFGNGTMENLTILDGRAQLELMGTAVWRQLQPGSSPEARILHSMATVPGTDKVLLFGGSGAGGYLNDTWLFDLSDCCWTRLAPPAAPRARRAAGLAPFDGTDILLLFGGETSYGVSGYTWLFNMSEGNWTRLTPAASPPARSHHSLATIHGTDRVLLFGGWNGSACLNDTWVFDLSEGNWTQLSPPESPAPRDTFSLAPVWGDDRVVLFGGSVGGLPANDTWVYDASENTWSRRSPPLSPPARLGSVMAQIPGEDRLVLFGGYENRRDTWIYDVEDDEWLQRDSNPRPSARHDHALAALSGMKKAILFGGQSAGTYRSDTWLLNLTGFCPQGCLTSAPIDAGGPSLFQTIGWKGSSPQGTAIRFQLRTAPTEAGLRERPFIGPDGTEGTYYESSGQSLWTGHDGDRWFQYRALLSTNTPELSPLLEEVRVGYDRWPDAPLLISPAEEGWACAGFLFSWEFRDGDGGLQGGYRFQVDESPGFDSIEYDSGNVESRECACAPVLPDGRYYWRVRTRDPEGVWGPFSEPRAVRVDRVPPELVIVAPLGPLVNTTSFTLYGTASDALSGLERVEFKVDDGEWRPASGTANWRAELNLTPGIHRILVRAVDVAGNNCTVPVEYLVNRPPTVRLLSPAEGARFNTSDEILLSLEAEDPDGDLLTIVWLDGSVPLGSGPQLSCHLSEGNHTVLATISDGRGHNITLSANISVFSVFPVPKIRILSPKNREELTCETVLVSFAVENFTFSGAPGGPHIRFNHCGSPDEEWYSTDPIVIPNLSNGQHIIRVWLVDAEGRRLENPEAYAEVNITVNDPRPDLAIKLQDISLHPSRPRAGDSVVVGYRVYNWGGSAAPPFNVSLYIDDLLKGNRSHLELGKGMNTTGKLKWRAEEGNFTLKLLVDPLNSIDERSEINNMVTLELSVGPAAPAARESGLWALAAALILALAAGGAGAHALWRRRAGARGARGGGGAGGLAPLSEPFTIDDIFLIYRDGRLVQHTTRRLVHGDDSSEIMASMLTVIQDFVKDALSRGEEVQLGSVEYGGRKILLERSKHLVLAAVVSGPEPDGLRAEMAQTLRNIEGEYSALLPFWDGDLGLLAGTKKFLNELSAFRAAELEELERRSEPGAPEQLRVLSEVEFYQGFARLKVAVKNEGDTLVADVALDLHFDEKNLRLDRIEPHYPVSGKRVLLGNIGPKEKKTVAYYLDPQICTESAVDGVVTYRDGKGGFHTMPLKRRMVTVVCPILYTDQNINTAMLRRMVSEELDQRDSKIFLVPPRFPIAEAFAMGKRVVEGYDVRLVREFFEKQPWRAEAWYYGKTKGRDASIVVRVSARDDTRTLEFFVASKSKLAVTGLLAELRAGLVKKQKEEMPARAGMEQVLDPAVRDKLFGDGSLLERQNE